jgi:DNA-binding LytR/AlgR family response regulator
MTALIVDDEPIARRVLREELEALPDVRIAGEAGDGNEALRKIAELQPDVVFLDLQMPGMSGFDVARNLTGPVTPAIVIVTAFDRHAIAAFEAGAIDYLLKPVSEERLRAAVERARKLAGAPREAARHVERVATMQPAGPSPSRKIVGRSGEEYFLLDAAEVLAFQADQELVWIVTSKQRFLSTQNLRTIERRLGDPQFRRVHRNAIVNINQIRKMSPLTSHRWLVTLSNGLQIVVSKRQASGIRQILEW